jgi:hypothetical protein
MHTRSSSTVSKRAVPASRVVYHRWTVSEEREMVRLRRYENKSFTEIAAELHRAPEAINFRFLKLVADHIEGGHDEKEVLRWFNLITE